MKSIPIFLLACFLLLPNSVSLAQAQQQPQRVPDGGTREVLISILIPALPNAPFTATVNTGWIRQLPDGSTITLKNHRAIARDAAGRIFQERRALVPYDGKAQSGVTQIEISDPVTHELYICMPQGRTCQVEVFSPPESFPYTPTAKAHVAKRCIRRQLLSSCAWQRVVGAGLAPPALTVIFLSGKTLREYRPLQVSAAFPFSALSGRCSWSRAKPNATKIVSFRINHLRNANFVSPFF